LLLLLLLQAPDWGQPALLSRLALELVRLLVAAVAEVVEAAALAVPLCHNS
jgi:hypothetical protein